MPETRRISVKDGDVLRDTWIEKPGFKTWQRTMTVSAGGSANVDATLEKTL